MSANRVLSHLEKRARRNIAGNIAIVTGGANGIGREVGCELAARGVRAIALVDMNAEALAEAAAAILQEAGEGCRNGDALVEVRTFVGDVVNEPFRKSVFDAMTEEFGVPPTILVPAAGITRDRMAVKVDKSTGKADIYPQSTFELVLNVNLLAPVFWALEMVGRIAESRKSRGLKKWSPQEPVEGTIVFVGSVSADGNPSQISYAASKSALEGVASTLAMEVIFHGIRVLVVRPGFTDTSMTRAIEGDYLAKRVLPQTLLGRMIQPDEIAEAIADAVSNEAQSGVITVSAGWRSVC